MALHHRLARVSRDRRWILRSSFRLALVFVVLGLGAAALRIPFGKPMLLPELTLPENPAFELDDPDSLAHWVRHLVYPVVQEDVLQSPERPRFETPLPLPLPTPPSAPPEAKEAFRPAKIVQEDPRLGLARQQLERALISARERELLLLLAEAYYGKSDGAAAARGALQRAAATDPPERSANAFFADTQYLDAAYPEARAAYLREARAFPEAAWSRERLRTLVLVEKDARALQSLISEFPTLLDGATVRERLQAAILLEDWLGIARAILEMNYLHIDPGLLCFALLAASIWFVIVTQFAGYEKPRLILYASALVLGVLSASAALYAAVVHQEVFDFQRKGDLLQTVIYYVAGVGLREESLKLILFLPLLPALLKHNEIDALVCGGLVGLGFALQENLSYYDRDVSVVITRLFSANFVHIALTGLLAVATWRLARRPGGKTAELWLATFLGVVVFHGLYDVFIGEPFLGLVIFVVIAYRFLDEAEALGRIGPHRALSPLATTFLGAIVLLGIGFIYSAALDGLAKAIKITATALFSAAIFGIVFFLRFKEH